MGVGVGEAVAVIPTVGAGEGVVGIVAMDGVGVAVAMVFMAGSAEQAAKIVININTIIVDIDLCKRPILFSSIYLDLKG